jgi:hypothetical protein
MSQKWRGQRLSKGFLRWRGFLVTLIQRLRASREVLC